jgi:hypothetical protein
MSRGWVLKAGKHKKLIPFCKGKMLFMGIYYQGGSKVYIAFEDRRRRESDDRAYMDIFTACLKRQYILYFRLTSNL